MWLKHDLVRLILLEFVKCLGITLVNLRDDDVYKTFELVFVPDQGFERLLEDVVDGTTAELDIEIMVVGFISVERDRLRVQPNDTDLARVTHDVECRLERIWMADNFNDGIRPDVVCNFHDLSFDVGLFEIEWCSAHFLSMFKTIWDRVHSIDVLRLVLKGRNDSTQSDWPAPDDHDRHFGPHLFRKGGESVPGSIESGNFVSEEHLRSQKGILTL